MPFGLIAMSPEIHPEIVLWLAFVDLTAEVESKPELQVMAARPWETTPQAWQRVRGVHAPWIAEISPAQFAGMSGRRKLAYQGQRSEEWAASAACKDEWKTILLLARKAGLFDRNQAGVSEAAFHADIHAEIEEEKQAGEARFLALEAQNDASGCQVGDVVFDFIAYGVVVKASAKSVRIDRPGGQSFNKGVHATRKSLRWLHYSDVKNQAATGQTELRRLTREEIGFAPATETKDT